MNFIVRNLGWILLIIFFIFMLYLISSQNNVKKGSLINSTNIVNTWAISLEKDENKMMVEKYNSEKNKISDEINIENNEKWFFEWVTDLLTFDDNEVENSKELDDYINKEEKKPSLEVNEDLILEIDNEININFKENNIEKKESIKDVETKNNIIKKVVDKKIAITKEKEVNTEKNISEKIKNKIEERNKNLLHKVWVHSIALNNPYFTKKVWYAYKGDTLEQLTNTNKYGCFNSEVLESEKSMWKKGWTCIYYMEWHLNEISKYQRESINYYKKLREKTINTKKVQNKIKYSNLEKKWKIDRAEDGSIIITKDPYRVYEGPTYETEVWSLYLVRVNSLILKDETFTTKKWYLENCTSKNCDVLEQLTPVNEEGCFKVNVFMSKTNKGKRWWVCQKFLR